MEFTISEQLVTLQNSGSNPLVRVAICNHIMAGYMPGTYARFNNPNEQVSAHFGVSRAGKIVQYVALDRWAYANGIVQSPDLSVKWLADAISKGENPNRRTISIEHEGFPSGSKDAGLTETQYQATVWLHRYIMSKFGSILPDRQHIIGHYQITGGDRANCPGPLFPWSRLIGDLQMSTLPTKVPGNFAVPVNFAAFWWKNGGLPIFGYPISSALVKPPEFPHLLVVQWFERARFEMQTNGTITLGLLGNEALARKG